MASLLNNQTLVSNGSVFYRDASVSEIIVFWNISGPITGTGANIQFTLEEVDPNDGITPVGQTITSPVITNIGVGNMKLELAISPTVQVLWTIGGSLPFIGGVSLEIEYKQVSNTVSIINDGYTAMGLVNQGNPNIPSNAWPVSITDGYNVLGTNSHPLITTGGQITSSTSITSSIGAAVSNTVLLSSNSNRIGATIYNDSNCFLYIKLGTVATFSNYTIKLFPFSYYEVPYGFTGEIDGIWTSSTGFARINEILP